MDFPISSHPVSGWRYHPRKLPMTIARGESAKPPMISMEIQFDFLVTQLRLRFIVVISRDVCRSLLPAETAETFYKIRPTRSYRGRENVSSSDERRNSSEIMVTPYDR